MESSSQVIELTNLSNRRTLQVSGEINDSSHKPLQEEPIEPVTTNTLDVVTSNEDSKDYPDGGLRAYTVILGSFLGLTAVFGTLNSVGAIQTYLATHQLMGVEASTISWIFSIHLALAFAVTIFTGPFFDSKGTFLPLVVGNILIFVGLFSTASCTTVWQFILAFSLCVGTGFALCISPLVGVVSHWFYDHIGLALGLSSIGGSVGGIIIPLMLRSLYTKLGFVWAIRVLAFFCSGLIGCSTILVKERFSRDLSNQQKTTSGNANVKDIESKRGRFINASKNFFDYSAIKDIQFVLLVLGVLCGEMALLSTVTYYGTYAVAQGMSESDSYVLLTLFNATGVLGRACPGYLSDKLGHFNIMTLMLAGSSVSVLVLWLPFGSNPVILYVFIAFFGFFSSLILSLTPVCLRKITPVHEFGSRYGLMYFFVSIGNLFGIPLAAAIIGDLSQFNYQMFSLFCGLMTTVATLFWIFCRHRSVGFTINIKI